jgi:hypothetical protein
MTIIVNIIRNQNDRPQDKLADAEVQFIGGELDGLKLLGFAVWKQRNGTGRNVTFPARPFVVSGEKRNFALLRAIEDRSAEDRVRQLVLQAYAEQEAANNATS